jgi:hypothetical protein
VKVCAVDECEKPARRRGWCGAHYQHWYKYGTPEKLTRHSVCTVSGCTKPADRKILGLCEAHYYQQRRHGQITSVEIKPYGTPGCKEPGCDSPHDSLGWCSMHYTRWQRHGDPQEVGKPDPRPGPLNPNWRGDDANYYSVHDRMRRARGPASAHACLHCGAFADEWAYDHTDPDELCGADGLPYSTDQSRYIPLCHRCHRQFDRSFRSASA